MSHSLTQYQPFLTNYLDDGGVFKAKGKKQKATEVREDKHVKEEVPIDKRKAPVIEVGLRGEICV